MAKMAVGPYFFSTNLVVLSFTSLDLDGRDTQVGKALNSCPADQGMIFKHVSLNLCHEVRFFQDPVPRRFAVRGEISKSHQGLKVLQAIEFVVQEVADRSDDVNRL